MTLFIRFKFVLLLMLVALSGVGLYYYTHQKEALKLILPEIKKITLIKADIHQDTAFVDVFAIAENNSPYKISIDSILYDLELGGTILLSEKQYIGLSQLPQQSDTVKFSLRVPIKHIHETIEKLQGQIHTDLTLDATIVYNTVLGIKHIKLSKDKKIEVPIPPRIRIVRTERKDLKLLKKEVKVDLFLEIVNEGKNIDLNISDLHYSLIIGKDLDTKGKFGKTIVIKPHSSILLKFPLDFEMNTPLATIFKIWTDTDRVPYKLELSGFIDWKNFDKRIPTVLFASGKLEIVNEEKKAQEKNKKRMKN